jgi:HEAT repeat protein
MAIDVLTKWLHEPRTITPLLLLLQGDVDAHRLVMAARGLGWLGNRAAIPALITLLLDQARPFVARVAAAQALGQFGGESAKFALQQATADERPSVAHAAILALKELARTLESEAEG